MQNFYLDRRQMLLGIGPTSAGRCNAPQPFG